MQKNNVKKNNNGFRNIVIVVVVIYAISVFASIIDFDSDNFQYENEDEIVNKPIIEEKQQELILTEEDALKNQDEENKDIEEEEVDLSFLNLNKKVDIEIPDKFKYNKIIFKKNYEEDRLQEYGYIIIEK